MEFKKLFTEEKIVTDPSVVKQVDDLKTELTKSKKEEEYYHKMWKELSEENMRLRQENKKIKKDVSLTEQGRVAFNLLMSLKEVFTNTDIKRLVELETERNKALIKLQELQK